MSSRLRQNTDIFTLTAMRSAWMAQTKRRESAQICATSMSAAQMKMATKATTECASQALSECVHSLSFGSDGDKGLSHRERLVPSTRASTRREMSLMRIGDVVVVVLDVIERACC